MKSVVLFCGLLAALVMTGCGRSKPAGDDGRLQVFVSIPPQAYIVERIAGDRVDCQVLVRPGQSPATYEPTPKQMAALAEAKLYFSIGVPFEHGFLPKVQMNKTQTGAASPEIVDTRQGITLREMKPHRHAAPDGHADHGHAGHQHREVGEHDDHHHADHKHGNVHDHAGHKHSEDSEHGSHKHHDGKDPHVWLSPRLVKLQARTIADALIRIDPAGKATYEANCAALIKDLEALDAKLTASLAPVKGKTFMVFHPSWGYFADAYGLKQEPIEVEGKEPSARQLARIVETAKAENIRVIFVQPQFSRASAQTIAAGIDGAVVPIDPLARDYIANLEAVAQTISDALSQQK